MTWGTAFPLEYCHGIGCEGFMVVNTVTTDVKQQIFVLAEGDTESIEAFCSEIQEMKPAAAMVDGIIV